MVNRRPRARHMLCAGAFFLFAALAIPASSLAGEGKPPAPAAIVLIIDDLGNSLAVGRRVVGLPAPIACAILPHTAYSTKLAEAAHASHKEVLLHLPMEPMQARLAAGPGVIESAMPAREITATLAYDLTSVPHAIGVNNHMGSRLTQNSEAMGQLMQAMRSRGNLLFVDSRTTANSVAARTAASHGILNLTRDVFLDDDPDPLAVRQKLSEVLALARRRGSAIAIGHPHPNTLAAVEAWIPTLSQANARIVTLSEMLRIRNHDYSRTLSLYP